MGLMGRDCFLLLLFYILVVQPTDSFHDLVASMIVSRQPLNRSLTQPFCFSKLLLLLRGV